MNKDGDCNMDNTKLAELLFPDVKMTPEQLEDLYPKRDLPEGAIVSRMAPSPTGFVHLGNLVQGLTSERLSHQSGGVLFLRVEDTDSKREVPGAVEILINSLKHYNIIFDEGATIDGDSGAYGPYRQRARKDIYHVYAKKLVEEGKAYPCFCTEEELFSIPPAGGGGEPFLAAVQEGVEYERNLLNEANDDAIAKLKDLGVNFYDIDVAELQAAYQAKAEEKGFDGGILSVIMGFDTNGTVTGIWVDASTQTKGIGSNVASDSFLAQFDGMDGTQNITLGQGYDAYSGATISSKALFAAINDCINCYNELA